MPLFLYVTCGGLTKLIDICLAIWRTTESDVKPNAIFLTHSMLDMEVCIFTVSSVYSQCMTHMNREDEYIIQKLLAPPMCVRDCQLSPASLCTTESHVSMMHVDCPMISVKMECFPSIVHF